MTIFKEFSHEHTVLKEKMDLLEKERRRLIQEIEQQKIYIENLKQSLNEQSLSEPSSSPLRFTPSSTLTDKKQVEELIKQKVRIKGIDSSLLDELRLSGEKIVSQLGDVKNMIETNQNHNVQIQPQATSQSENNNENKENDIQKDENDNEKAEQNGEEAPKNENKEDENKDNIDQEQNNKTIKINIDEAFKSNFMQLVDDVEMTFQLIVPKFLEINEKIKQKEKEIVDLLKGDFLESLRQLEEGQSERVSSEQVQELEAKVNETRSKLIKMENMLTEVRSELSCKKEELEKSKKTNDNLQEQFKLNHNLLNEQIDASKTEIEALNSKISI